MAITEYDYTKTPCAVDRLLQEIQLSAIVTAVDHINLLDDQLAIFFVSALSGGDVTILNGLVSAHSGVGLATDFIKVAKTTSTSTSSSSFVVLDSMVTPNLIAGQYFVFFRGEFSTNVPLLSQPGVTISIFNDGTEVADSEMTQVSTNSGALFNMVTISQMTVAVNKIIDIRWKTNGAGNSITCINRLIALIRQK